MEYSPVAVVIDLDRAVEAGGHGKGVLPSIAALLLHGEVLPRPQLAGEARERQLLESGNAEALGVLARLELHGQHPHPDKVAAVDALEALRDHRPYAEEERPLGRPVPRRAAAVLLARHDHEGSAVLAVALGGVE